MPAILTRATHSPIVIGMKEIRLYTDGACHGNPGPGGYGVVLLFGEHRKELSGGYRKTTNNRMELKAVIKGLEALREKCKVELYSDSKYVVDALSKGWAAKWRANGWRRNGREPAINPDLWGRLLELCEAHDMTFHWVKGHSGNPENERCDQLATEAATQPNLPADELYEGTAQIPMEQESAPFACTRHEDPSARAVHSVRSGLHSPNADRRKQAIFQAVREKLAQLGPDLIELMKSESDPGLESRCAWALGKLNYREAELALIPALSSRAKEVRTWSAWALGEIGNARTEPHLRRALDRENLDDVRRSIGGALKKLNFDSTRAHVSQLRKALQPPETQDPTLVALMDRLEQLEWEADADKIVELRAAMKGHAPDFFNSYMEWVRRKPEIIATLKDDRRVFS